MHFRDAYILHIVSEISQIALHTCILQCRFAIWMYEVYVLVHLHFKSKSLWLLTLIYWNLIRRIPQKIILSFCVEVHQLCSDLSNSNSILMYPHNVSFRMKVLYLLCTYLMCIFLSVSILKTIYMYLDYEKQIPGVFFFSNTKVLNIL